jgi:hypothetical protein
VTVNHDRYRRFRASDVPALLAAKWARVPLDASPELDVDALWLTWAGFDVCVRWVLDPRAPEPRGKFTNNERSMLWGARKLPESAGMGARRYFEPTHTALAHRRSLTHAGMSRQVAQETGERFVSKDLATTLGRIGHPLPVVLAVTVFTRGGHRLAQQRYAGIETGVRWPTHDDVLDYLSTDTNPVVDTVATAQRILAERGLG